MKSGKFVTERTMMFKIDVHDDPHFLSQVKYTKNYYATGKSCSAYSGL